MKTNLKRKTHVAAIGLMMACATLTGCVENDVYNPNAGKPELKPETEYPNFATTGYVQFDVNYGKLAGEAVLEIYTQTPISYNEDGTYTMNGEAIYKNVTDENGQFNYKVEIPTAVSKVYIYSSNWGAPLCVEATIENGKVTVDTTTPSSRSAMTRANDELKIKEINKSEKIYSVVEWNNIGEISDVNNIKKDGDIDADAIKRIQSTLWGKNHTVKPHGLNNKHLVLDTKYVNTSIARAYKNELGETVNVTSAELFFTFLTERAGYQSVIGYYYYETENKPNSSTDIDKFIIIPNASIGNDAPYENEGPIKKNTQIQLLYKDKKTGEVSTHFPPGYTIGYFILADGFNSSNGNIKSDQTFIYSNKDWNESYEGQQARFISLTDKTSGEIIYGVEDGADTSYEDVLFSITANPNESIQMPDRPVIDPEYPTITTTETTYRSYAFEDTWPSGNDYDLNDVIVEHKREIIMENGYVTKVTDSFTPIQRNNAASYINAFAVQYKDQRGNKIELPENAIDELNETNSVILFTDATNVQGRVFSVTRTFAAETIKRENLKTDSKEDLNPFIIAEYNKVSGEGRTEIHLPKAKATSKANRDQINSGDDAYYIDKKGIYPFGIMIPIGTTEGSEPRFIPATEKTKISLEYLKYESWINSKETQDTDWYLHHTPLN